MSEEQSIVDLAKQGLNAYSSAREELLQLRQQITVRLSELQETLEAFG